jgi:hypothetical protein
MGNQDNRGSAPARDGFLAYCVLSGAVATLAGAAASLLAGGAGSRLLVWIAVAAVVACAAGIWWGRSPARARRLVVGRLLRSGHR